MPVVVLCIHVEESMQLGPAVLGSEKYDMLNEFSIYLKEKYPELETHFVTIGEAVW